MLNRLTLDEVVSEIARLPSLPTVVLEVLASFDAGQVDVDRIVNELAQDPSLSARVLRLANSSFYGLQTRVGSLHDAVVVLGFRQVRATVAAVAVTRCLADHSLPGFDFPAFWRHCIAVGMAARRVAEQVGESGERAFIAGLLHDIGWLVLFAAFPRQSLAVLEYARYEHCLIVEAEHEIIGIDHSLVGGALAARWHFPENIAEAIRAYRYPDDLPAGSLAGIVHFADGLVHALGIADGLEDLVPPLSDTVFHRLALGLPEIKAIMGAVEADLDSTCHALIG